MLLFSNNPEGNRALVFYSSTLEKGLEIKLCDSEPLMLLFTSLMFKRRVRKLP